MLALSTRGLWGSAYLFVLCVTLISTTLVLAQPVVGDGDSAVINSRSDSSLGASDKSNQLPIQISGIAASYVIFDALIVFLILFVGRRLRREAHSSNYSLEMVMLSHGHNKFDSDFDPSPISDYSVDSQFPSPVSPIKQTRGWDMSWPSGANGAGGGGGGHAQHKSRPSINSSVATIDESVVSADRRRAQEEMEYLYAAVMEHDAKKASVHTTPVTDEKSLAGTPLASPMAQAFPPQSHPQYQFQPPLSPRQENIATNKPRSSRRLSKLSNLSIFSPSSRSSAGSTNNKLKSPTSVRDLPISPPVKSPELVKTATYYQENQPPLSPRIYNPGPPPTAPLSHGYNRSSNSNSIQSPKGTSSFNLQPIAGTPNSSSTTMRTINVPPPLSINSSNSTLPFRSQFNPPQSAPYTKTTILERPVNVSGGPRTGMPTPYSPYMPFTPVTPLTPSRLVTKRDRKKQNKAQGLKVLHEDDLVKNDDELWGT